MKKFVYKIETLKAQDRAIGMEVTVSKPLSPLPMVGEAVTIIRAEDQKHFTGKVTFVYPVSGSYDALILEEL